VHIDWTTLGTIAVVAAAAALSVVLLVSLALVASPGPAGTDVDGPANAHPAVGRAVAGLCLLAAGLIVCFGLYLIIA
jgi:hypothetical protein